jgi:hypothetical protein
MEIDLLKNLNHANIVKYNGFVKSAESLYIILEYAIRSASLLNFCLPNLDTARMVRYILSAKTLANSQKTLLPCT